MRSGVSTPLTVFTFTAVASAGCCAQVEAQQTTSKISLSGFARIVGGVLDDNRAEYQGFDSSFSLRPNSLVGLKGEYRFNQHFTAVAQGVVSRADARPSGFDWLYLGYQPNAKWNIKFGRFRTPFFHYSEVLDVGFAYPWVLPPQTTYTSALFASNDGIDVDYSTAVGDTQIQIGAHAGEFSGQIFGGGDNLDSEVDLLAGVNLKLLRNGWDMRLGYVSGDFEADLVGVQEFAAALRQLNFNRTADFLATEGKVEFFQLSTGYETFNYFARGELTHIRGEQDLVPDISSFYVTTGLYRGAMTYYLTYALLDTDNSDPVREIPLGVAPQLDGLAANFQRIFDNLVRDNITTITAGLRWDLRTNLALKAEISWLDGEANQQSTFDFNNQDFDRKATLTLLSLDYLF